MCTNMTFIAPHNAGVKAHRVRCNSWTCSYCAERRKKRLIKEAMLGRPNRFITLTVNPSDYRTPHEAARALSLAWRRCRDTLKRYHGHKAIESLAVFERHKSGYPHLHILARCSWISQKWLSNYFDQRINAPIVDIRYIKSRKSAIGYVTKYIAKNPFKFRGVKRYWRTANYSEKQKRQDGPKMEWSILRAPLERLLRRAEEQVGITWQWISDDKSAAFLSEMPP